jgi:hypothetical protein
MEYRKATIWLIVLGVVSALLFVTLVIIAIATLVFGMAIFSGPAGELPSNVYVEAAFCPFLSLLPFAVSFATFKKRHIAVSILLSRIWFVILALVLVGIYLF